MSPCSPANLLAHPNVKVLVYAGTSSQYDWWMRLHRVPSNRGVFVTHSIGSLAVIPVQVVDVPWETGETFWIYEWVGDYHQRAGKHDFQLECYIRNIRSVFALCSYLEMHHVENKHPAHLGLSSPNHL